MSYLDVSFQKDLFRELLIVFGSLDDLYKALPTQLWHLLGPHGDATDILAFGECEQSD